MATKSAGRVTIRVLPDSTGFRRDLKTALDRIEKTTHVRIPAELVVTRESIRELRRQLTDLEVKIKVEPFITQDRLHQLQKQIEDLDPQLQVGVNALRARAQLAVLTRPRIVELFVKVNQASLLGAAATLAALSGARVLGNVFDKFWDAIKNLDKNAPRIGAIATGIVSLAGGILALTSNLAGLAGSFATLGQAAVILPALFTGAAIGIGVLIAVLKDGKTVLADLAPAFHNLQDSLSNNFWNIAAQPIRDLVNNLMPTLREQLNGTARSLGVVTRQLALALGENLTNDRLATMFGNLNRAITRSGDAMSPLISAMTTLGLAGSRYLPRLSDWFVKLSEDFNRFIGEAAADGRLDQWANRGIEAFKDLGRVLHETVRVFGALTRAAEAAGGAGFDQLANGLGRLADTMNSVNFQTTLTSMFRGAHAMMDGIIDGLNRLGVGLAAFAPTLESIFGTAGEIISAFLQNISRILQEPAFQRGMQMFFDGFLSFMRALEPAMPALAQIVGLIGEIAGVMLQAFGPVVSDAIKLFAPIFQEIWEAVRPLIPVLSELIREIMPPLADVFMILAKEVLPVVVPLIAELAPLFAELVKALAPILVEVLKGFAEALRIASPYITVVADALTVLTDAFNGLPLAFYQAGTGDMGGFIGTMAKIFTDHPELPAVIGAFSTALGGLTEKADGLLTFSQAMGPLTDGIGLLITIFTSPTGLVNGIGLVIGAFTLLTGMLPSWETFWAGVRTTVDTYMPGLPSTVTTALSLIQTGFQSFSSTAQPVWAGLWAAMPPHVSGAFTLIQNNTAGGFPGILVRITGGMAGVIASWQGLWPQLLPTVTSVMGSAAGAVQLGFPGIVASVIGGMAGVLSNFDVGWMQVLISVTRWFGEITGGVGRGITAVLANTRTLPGQILAGLQNVGGFFFAGFNLLSDFAEGVAAGARRAIIEVAIAIKQITDMLPGSPAKKGPLSGHGWTRVRGQHLVEDMALGMRDRTDALKKQADVLAHAVSFDGTIVSGPSVSSVVGDLNDRALVHIDGDYYGATPELVAEEFNNKVRRASIAVSLGSVGK